MHLILMSRGIYQSHEVWKTFMQAQMFNFKQKPILKDEKGNMLKNPDGTTQYGPERISGVQGSLRPIQLWEYVFPQESLQEVLAMLHVNKEYNNLRPEIKSYAWLLRKMMGAKKIPDMPDCQSKEYWQITNRFIPMQGVAVYPLGIREDVMQDFDFGKEGAFYQEGI